MSKTALYIHGGLIGVRRIQPIGGARSKTAKHLIKFRCEKCQSPMEEFTEICANAGIVLIDCQKCDDVRGYAFIDTKPGEPLLRGDMPACVLHMVHSKRISPFHYKFSEDWEVWSSKGKYRGIKVVGERWYKREAGVDLKIVGLHSCGVHFHELQVLS